MLIAGREAEADGPGFLWGKVGVEIDECGDVEVVGPNVDGGGVGDIAGEEVEQAVGESEVAGDFVEVVWIFEPKGLVVEEGMEGEVVIAECELGVGCGWMGG